MIEALKRRDEGVEAEEAPAFAETRRGEPRAEREFSWNILTAIGSHPILFVAALLATLALAGLYLASAQPRYVATATFTIDPQVLFHPDRERNYPDPSLADSQTQLLRSDFILLPAVRHPEFAAHRENLLLPGLLDPVREALGRSPAQVDFETALVRSIREHMRVVRAGGSYVVEMSVTALSPEAAARGANTIARTYLDRAAQERVEAQNATQLRVEMALADAWEAFLAAEEDLQEFRATRPGIVTGARGEAGRGDALDTALAAASERVALAQARLERAQTEGDGERIRALEASLADAQAWRERVEETLGETRGFSQRQREDQVSLARLEARAQARRLAYEEQLQALSQFAQRAPVVTNATMLSAARPPERAASPRPALTLVAALFAGIVLAAALCLAASYWRWRRKRLEIG